MNKIKRFLLLVFVLVFSLVSVVFAEETINYDENVLKNDAEALYVAIVSMNDLEAEFFKGNTTDMLKKGIESFESLKSSIGEYETEDVKADDIAVEKQDDHVDVIVTGTLGDEQVQMTVEYRNLLGELQRYKVSFAFLEDENAGLAQRMLDALMNTIIGLTTVFLVLILIAFIIWLFKFIPVIQKKFSNRKKKNQVAHEAVDHAIAQIEAKEETGNLADNLELAAAIAAAIAAYEGTGTDSFVVRSIKKSRSNKRRNA